MTATSAQEPAIRIHALTKSYSELEVLRGVNFEVARGSIFALLGSNGAGKTTVVKIVSTLLKADAGEATVNGFDVAGQAAEVRKSISLTGQFAAVDEILTIGAGAEVNHSSGTRSLLLIDAVSVRRTQAPARRLSGDRTARSSRAQRFITHLRDGFGGDVIGERAGAEPALELVGELRRADQVDSAFADGGSVAQPLQI